MTPAGRNVTFQAISGTGALRLGAEFLARWFPGPKKIYLPSPSWGNHNAILTAGGLEVGAYRYYDKNTSGFDFEGAKEDIRVRRRRTKSCLEEKDSICNYPNTVLISEHSRGQHPALARLRPQPDRRRSEARAVEGTQSGK